MHSLTKILLATTFAVALGSGVASAATMDDQGTGAESTPDVHIVLLKPGSVWNNQYGYYLSQPAMYHAKAISTLASNPALSAELRSQNVEMGNVMGVRHWSDGSYSVFLR